MKFAEHLGAHITPEWRKQYIQYEEMKSMMYAAMEAAPSMETVDDDERVRHYAMFDETFFSFCDKELTKINTFYAEKLAEATRKFANLKSELHEASRFPQTSNGMSIFKKKTVTFSGPRKMDGGKQNALKLAFSEFYLSLILLQNYQTLNFTGFRKILKKRDKLVQSDSGAKWREENVESAPFYTNKDIDKLIADTEATVITDLEGGDRQKAMKRLRVPPLGDQQSPWTTFKCGLFAGAFMVLMVAVVLTAVFHGPTTKDNYSDHEFGIAIRLYRGSFLVIQFMFLMGVNVYGWRSSGVNHVLIFELDPRNHLSEQHIMELSAIFGVIWTISVLLFLYSEEMAIPRYICPLALVVTMTLFMLSPIRRFRHEARFWTLRVLFRIATAPFFYVGFADFWLADQLNSLGQALADFQYLVCFYMSTGFQFINRDWNVGADEVGHCGDKSFWVVSVVAGLPAWFRLAQCLRRYRDTREAFPHLVNAGKYSTTLFVILFAALNAAHGQGNGEEGRFSPFFYLWIISSVISSSYAYFWDIKMDWGFFADKTGENKFLREECVYSSKYYYYFAIVEDFVLRFAWTISLTISTMPKYAMYGDIVVSILAPLEVVRRFVWNFFRLENEHLNNCGKFRAVRDISVAPIDASDQQEIIKMMDEPDPAVYFRRRGVKKREVKKQTGRPQDLVPLLNDLEARA